MKLLDHAAAVEVLAREDRGRGYGRLGCFSPSRDEVYVVPVSYRFQDSTAYFACLPGQTLDYLRAHPAGVCLEVDDIDDESDWVSVIATGRVEELSGMEYEAERQLAVSRAADGPL
ncbi:MAG TPA: pyridoxamine 5'-phosphate oxidase family protein, partial [Chloroflexota bacterium]|nr:pyridoxamine 5'-phosphate oxidase family protein [Chloroflexota bacterium]